jgi:hypothetical protein
LKGLNGFERTAEEGKMNRLSFFAVEPLHEKQWLNSIFYPKNYKI